MKKEGPDIDAAECNAFKTSFQRAILLSLLDRHLLTEAQFEACVDKVAQKYAVRPDP